MGIPHPLASPEFRTGQKNESDFEGTIVKINIGNPDVLVKCLPLASLIIRTMPHSEMGLSPFEMLYGMPYKHEVPVGHPRLEDSQIQPYLTAINKNLQELRKHGIVSQSTPLGFAIHKIRPEDKVLVKVWKDVPLSPYWEGPFVVLLMTDMAIWLAEKGWTHASQLKKVKHQEEAPKWRITSSPGDLKIKLRHSSKGPMESG